MDKNYDKNFINQKVLTSKDTFDFGKYKDSAKTVEWVAKFDGDYIRWIIENKIRNIKFSKDVIINPLSTKRHINVVSFYDNYEYSPINRDYSESHFDLIDSGDYYSSGCDIYNLG